MHWKLWLPCYSLQWNLLTWGQIVSKFFRGLDMSTRPQLSQVTSYWPPARMNGNMKIIKKKNHVIRNQNQQTCQDNHGEKSQQRRHEWSESSPDMISFTQYSTQQPIQRTTLQTFPVWFNITLSYTRGVLFSVHLAPKLWRQRRKKKAEGGKKRERWDIRRERLPSSSHLLVAPKRGFRRLLLCKRFTCLLCRSESPFALFWGITQQISSLALQVYHERRCTEARRALAACILVLVTLLLMLTCTVKYS